MSFGQQQETTDNVAVRGILKELTTSNERSSQLNKAMFKLTVAIAVLTLVIAAIAILTYLKIK
ncbi:hypothetical protein COV06_00920 [Candidatus Uhrbacteria bacterium CG10_big_fil_rev_8_21_14_0_10_50_16]|uniref:Uncharacterized protein n=1 Tax=Candidatus Uhrbacteria bacterium CG10_big_fil_rev_8_21_14_0_10_50_16 TaxID=1975039 RepID=A0A2H0RN63_9BACT|nr:MAG: hypothetical protein COV06_00920 [Candidatus Uhrbacteria bacterium CG10_big_fil_rev_8_21_14_0_10_50_16]